MSPEGDDLKLVQFRGEINLFDLRLSGTRDYKCHLTKRIEINWDSSHQKAKSGFIVESRLSEGPKSSRRAMRKIRSCVLQ